MKGFRATVYLGVRVTTGISQFAAKGLYDKGGELKNNETEQNK